MILFVDDEKRFMDSYSLELELLGYKVSFQKDVDTALAFLKTHPSAVELLILDVMMPPGQSFQHENTNNGLRTGVRFYERIRALSPMLPVIIFTNVSDEQVERRFQAEPNCRFFRKEDYLPFELAEEVKKLTPPPVAR
jgi:CheY-like chemotaxis protein